MIYEPAEDSELLRKHIKDYAQGKVLDMGTGSGVLAEEASKYAKEVLACDINDEAVQAAKAKGIKAVHSDLFSNIKETFDLITFNPPYLPYEEMEDEDTRLMTTGGKIGSEILEKFLSQAYKLLNPDGKILIVFSSLTLNIDLILRKYNYQFKQLDEKDVFFEKLYVYLVWR